METMGLTGEDLRKAIVDVSTMALKRRMTPGSFKIMLDLAARFYEIAWDEFVTKGVSSEGPSGNERQ